MDHEYSQAHLPVTQQKEAVGHAVRANYMYSAMADVAALTGDSAYLQAIGKIWENVAEKNYPLPGVWEPAAMVKPMAKTMNSPTIPTMKPVPP